MLDMVKKGGAYEPDVSAAISGAGAEVGGGFVKLKRTILCLHVCIISLGHTGQPC